MYLTLDKIYEDAANSQKSIFVFHSIKNNLDDNNILTISLRYICRSGDITPAYVSRVVKRLRDIGFMKKKGQWYMINPLYVPVGKAKEAEMILVWDNIK